MIYYSFNSEQEAITAKTEILNAAKEIDSLINAVDLCEIIVVENRFLIDKTIADSYNLVYEFEQFDYEVPVNTVIE